MYVYIYMTIPEQSGSTHSAYSVAVIFNPRILVVCTDQRVNVAKDSASLCAKRS